MTTLMVRGGEVIGSEHRRADVLVDRDRITAIEPIDSSATGPGWAPVSVSVLDASGCWVLPGFVDLQVNGALGVDLTTQPERVDEVATFLPQCGVTSFMPTIISSPLDDVDAAVATMRRRATVAASNEPSGARSLGVHIEGPFLNPARRGAHPQQHLRPPCLDVIVRWTRDAGVAMVTIAPELPGAMEVIARLVERGIVVSIGHTDADAVRVGAAAQAGVRGVTHLFNAMSPMSARSPGTAGATLTNPHLIAGLIIDGLHVDRTMVQLAWRMLGPTRIALVSDSMAALGLPYGTYAIGDAPVVVDGDGVRTSQGVLAGSVLRFDQAVRTLMVFTGCDLVDASQAASATPARLAGVADIGCLDVGCVADVVLLDDAHQVAATVVGGHVVWDPQKRCAPWKS